MQSWMLFLNCHPERSEAQSKDLQLPLVASIRAVLGPILAPLGWESTNLNQLLSS
jgi:hypothetical protein